jgi:hypothetical protein
MVVILILTNYGTGGAGVLESKMAGQEPSCTHSTKEGGFPALLLVGGDGLGTLRKSCSKEESSGVVKAPSSSLLSLESAGRTGEGEGPKGQTTEASAHGARININTIKASGSPGRAHPPVGQRRDAMCPRFL